MLARRHFAHFISVVVPALALLLTGCPNNGSATAGGATTNQPKQLAQVSTRIKWLPGATYIGSFVAKESGFWRELGLDVTIYPGGFEADPIKLVAAGSNDFGITGSEQLLQARTQGVPIVAIYMELKHSPAGWMSLKESGITEPAHFLGKKVGAQYGTNLEPTLDALLAKLNIDPTTLNRVPVKYDVAPLFSGAVDVLPVYLNGQPVQARLEGKDVNTINPADYGISLYGNVYFTSERMISEKPDVVARFVRGLRRGWKLAMTDPAKAVDYLVKSQPMLDPKLEKAILDATRPFVTTTKDPRLGFMLQDRWEETKSIMVKYAQMAESVDLQKAFTNRFVEQAEGTRPSK